MKYSRSLIVIILFFSTMSFAQKNEGKADSLASAFCACISKPSNEISRTKRLEKIDALVEAGANLNTYCDLTISSDHKGTRKLLAWKYSGTFTKTKNYSYHPLFFFTEDTLMLESLIQRGCDVEVVLSPNDTKVLDKLAQVAYSNEDLEMLRFLKRIGVSFEELRVETDSIEIIDYILANGGAILLTNEGKSYKNRVSYKALSDFSILQQKNYKKLITYYKLDLNKMSFLKLKELFFRSTEEAKWLLDHGLDIQRNENELLAVFFGLDYSYYRSSRLPRQVYSGEYGDPNEKPGISSYVKKAEAYCLKWLDFFKEEGVDLNVCYKAKSPIRKVIESQNIPIIKKMIALNVKLECSCKEEVVTALALAEKELERLKNSYPTAIHYIKQAEEIVKLLK